MYASVPNVFVWEENKKKQIKRHKYMLNEKQFQIQIEKKNT